MATLVTSTNMPQTAQHTATAPHAPSRLLLTKTTFSFIANVITAHSAANQAQRKSWKCLPYILKDVYLVHENLLEMKRCAIAARDVCLCSAGCVNSERTRRQQRRVKEKSKLVVVINFIVLCTKTKGHPVVLSHFFIWMLQNYENGDIGRYWHSLSL